MLLYNIETKIKIRDSISLVVSMSYGLTHRLQRNGHFDGVTILSHTIGTYTQLSDVCKCNKIVHLNIV